MCSVPRSARPRHGFGGGQVLVKNGVGVDVAVVLDQHDFLGPRVGGSQGSTALSANRRSVQRLCPVGAGVRPRAVSAARAADARRLVERRGQSLFNVAAPQLIHRLHTTAQLVHYGVAADPVGQPQQHLFALHRAPCVPAFACQSLNGRAVSRRQNEWCDWSSHPTATTITRFYSKNSPN